MLRLRHALLPLCSLFSCEEVKPAQSSPVDLGDSGSGSDSASGEISVIGDLELDALADLCTEYATVDVKGSVTLSPTDGTDLSSVDCLGATTGDLVIEGDTLTEIDLPDLTQVGGNLAIESLAALENITLNALMEVGGSLQVVSNPYLGVLSLEEICDVGTSIVIRGNSEMLTANLANLVSIHLSNQNARSQAEGEAGIDISDNASLEQLDLGNVETIGCPLMIDGNDALTSLDIGRNSTVIGDLQISNNASLQEVNLELLSQVHGSMILENNPFLTTSESIAPALQTIQGSLELVSLVSMNQVLFPMLTKVEGSVVLTDVGQDDVSGGSINFRSLETLSTDIKFRNIGAESINLSSLQTLPGNLLFANSDYLTSVTLYEGLHIEGNLKLIGNAALTDVESFAHLSDIGGIMEIRENPALETLTGMHNIMSIRQGALAKKAQDVDTCDTLDFNILICGNDSLTLEESCALLETLTDSGAQEGDSYIYAYDVQPMCPEDCPESNFICSNVCVGSNLDDDGDGFSENEGDCDDQDSLTFPGAAEKDSETLCMTDNDGDGWGNCSPSGDLDIEPGTDCDDADPSMNNDDIDGDTWSTCDGDCDDEDPEMYPGINDCEVTCSTICP